MSWKEILKIDIDEARRLGDKYSPKDMKEEANETELHVEPETPTTPLKWKAERMRGLIHSALPISQRWPRGADYAVELQRIVDLKNEFYDSISDIEKEIEELDKLDEIPPNKIDELMNKLKKLETAITAKLPFKYGAKAATQA